MTLEQICEKVIVKSVEGIDPQFRVVVVKMIAEKLKELQNPYVKMVVDEYVSQKCAEQREICSVEAGTKKYSQEIDRDTIRNAYDPNFD